VDVSVVLPNDTLQTLTNSNPRAMVELASGCISTVRYGLRQIAFCVRLNLGLVAAGAQTTHTDRAQAMQPKIVDK